MNGSFFSPEQAPDPSYNRIRDNPDRQDARSFVEFMWQKYAPFAEPRFLDKAKQDFYAKTWEMYLGYVFLNHGFALQKKVREEGPDICLKAGKSNIWIEAVAPTSGTGDNKVLEYIFNEATDTPEEQVLLRFDASVPDTLKDKLAGEKIRVMLLLEDEEAMWHNFTVSEFMKGYSEKDSIYDSL